MGKKRHTRDKLWMSYNELSLQNEENGGENKEVQERYLPFDYCSLSLTPFTTPVSDDQGYLYDNKYIIPYIAKFKKNPISGSSDFSIKNLTKLNFYKGHNGNYACPITLKEFNENMKIVAIKESGNVYSYEAFDELNQKPNNNKDLVNEIEFDFKNVIIIHDPDKKKKIMDFAFLHNGKEVDYINQLVNNIEKPEDEESNANVNLPSNYSKLINDYNKSTAPDKIRKMQIIDMINNNESILVNEDFEDNIQKEYENFKLLLKKIENDLLENKLPISKIKGSISISSNCYLHHLKQTNNWKKFYLSQSQLQTNGKMALSLTSTEMNVNTKSTDFIPNDNDLRLIYQNIVKSKQLKGYVKMVTSFGDINFEILCDKSPLASENFMELCNCGKYNNTKFHRLVKNFVVQGGDVGNPGSFFGKPFKDEFLTNGYSHNTKGILSMANSGKNTNATQFFITLDHNKAGFLDNKHTIFGQVVGGIKTLDLINKIGNNKEEKHLRDIMIIQCQVFNNPFRDVIRELVWKEIMESYGIIQKKEYEKDSLLLDKLKNITKDEKGDNSIGKYLGKKRAHKEEQDKEDLQRKIQLFKENEDLYLFDNKKKKNQKRELFSDW